MQDDSIQNTENKDKRNDNVKKCIIIHFTYKLLWWMNYEHGLKAKLNLKLSVTFITFPQCSVLVHCSMGVSINISKRAKEIRWSNFTFCCNLFLLKDLLPSSVLTRPIRSRDCLKMTDFLSCRTAIRFSYKDFINLTDRRGQTILWHKSQSSRCLFLISIKLYLVLTLSPVKNWKCKASPCF